MADEAKVTPEAEKIATPGVDAPKEGTVEAEVAKVEPKVEPEVKTPETVPLKQYLELKSDLKTLKQEIKESKGSERSKVEVQGLSELSEKYPDVNQEFLKDLLSSATNTATKKIEDQYASVIEKQEAERKQVAFDKAFDTLFDKTLLDNPELPKSIDKDAIKALASTPKYRNVPLAEILSTLYSTTPGKTASENEMRSAADKIDDIVNFEKITPDQKKAILADPQARTKYFSWLDKNNR